MHTTLNQIRACSPCGLDPRKKPLTGYQLLVSHLPADFSPDAPISIADILKSNGLDDALWCLRAVKGYDREIKLLAVDFARSVEHPTNDPRVKACTDVTDRLANDLATVDEIEAARAAAWTAAWAAGTAASVAAWTAARKVQSNLLAIVCTKIENHE